MSTFVFVESKFMLKTFFHVKCKNKEQKNYCQLIDICCHHYCNKISSIKKIRKILELYNDIELDRKIIESSQNTV